MMSLRGSSSPSVPSRGARKAQRSAAVVGGELSPVKAAFPKGSRPHAALGTGDARSSEAGGARGPSGSAVAQWPLGGPAPARRPRVPSVPRHSHFRCLFRCWTSKATAPPARMGTAPRRACHGPGRPAPDGPAATATARPCPPLALRVLLASSSPRVTGAGRTGPQSCGPSAAQPAGLGPRTPAPGSRWGPP